MIKEIVANIKSDDLEIFIFEWIVATLMKKIIETIESLGCKYLIKAKKLFYTHLHKQRIHQLYSLKGEEGRETTELYTKLVKWEKRQKICRISRTETRKRKSTIITF